MVRCFKNRFIENPLIIYWLTICLFFKFQLRVDMLTYGFIPFAIMFLCSIIIIRKLYSSKKKKFRKDKKTKDESFSRKLSSFLKSYTMSKEKQVTSILLITNFLFIFLVSPLLVMNVLNMLRENTLRATIAYFLCYANHG